MKPTKLVGPFVLALIFVSLTAMGAYVLFALPNRKDPATLSTSEAISAVAAPIDVSKLHAANISRVELHCNGAASIAPDNEHYVCAGVLDNPGLWLGSLGKGLQKRLSENGALPAVWLPNGKGIVYSETDCIDPATRTPVASYYTAVSPDGKRVAEACAGSLYLIDVRAGKTSTLTDQVAIFVRPMAWSPDGGQLAFSIQPDSTRVAELWLANADGSGARSCSPTAKASTCLRMDARF